MATYPYDDSTSEDPESWLTSRGATPAEDTGGSQMSPADLQQMLQMYQAEAAKPTPYSQAYAASREQGRAQQAQLEQAVQAAYDRRTPGPSKQEMYFKLAQAFLTPGKTGNFTEGLAGAAGVGAEYRGKQQAAREADINAQRSGSIELGKLRLGATKEESDALGALDSDARKDRRAVMSQVLKQYMMTGKPQSTIGKILADGGYKMGTPEYKTKYEELLKAELARKAATLNFGGFYPATDPQGKPALISRAPDGSIQQVPGYTPPVKPINPRSTAAIAKLESDDLSDIMTGRNSTADVLALKDQIDTGKLKLGLWNNAVSEARNYTNHSDPNSLAYGNLKAGLEKLRNDSLRLNKGTQTEGDAQRTWQEIVAHINDGPYVSERLKNIAEYNRRAAEERTALIQIRRQTMGMEDFDESKIPQPGSVYDGGKPPPAASPPARPPGRTYNPSNRTFE